MLPKPLRLNAQTRLHNPSIHHTAFFTLRITRNQEAHNRYGFIVSKKVDKRAVVRNTLRRRMSSYIQELDSSLPKGYDMIFSLKPKSSQAAQEALFTAVRSLVTHLQP